MPYEIEIVDTVPGSVLELRRMVHPEHIGEDIATDLAELYAEVAAAGLHPVGPPAVTYLDSPVPGQPMSVDLGIAVAPGAARARLGEDARIVGRHSRPVARTVHVGSYTGIGAAYQALDTWLTGHGYRSAGPPTETYLTGPDTEVDPARYRTEVSIPIVPSFAVSVRVEDDVQAAVERTRNALRSHGFDTVSETDLRAVSRAGADQDDLVVLVVCDPELVRRALDVDRQAALLPTVVAVRAEGDATVVEALDPTVLVQATGLAELGPVASETRRRLAEALASLRTEAPSWTT